MLDVSRLQPVSGERIPPHVAAGAGRVMRIVLLDSLQVVREGIRSILRATANVEVVGDFSTGVELIGALPELQPDLVMLDLGVGDISGAELIRAIHAPQHSARSIVFCCRATPDELAAALQAGVSAYLPRQATAADLHNAVQAAASGGVFIHPLLQNRVLATATSRNNRGHCLTGRELDVLRCMCQGLSNSEIGLELGLTVGTVKVHVSRVIGKLGAADRTQAVVEALKRQLVRPPT